MSLTSALLPHHVADALEDAGLLDPVLDLLDSVYDLRRLWFLLGVLLLLSYRVDLVFIALETVGLSFLFDWYHRLLRVIGLRRPGDDVPPLEDDCVDVDYRGRARVRRTGGGARDVGGATDLHRKVRRRRGDDNDDDDGDGGDGGDDVSGAAADILRRRRRRQKGQPQPGYPPASAREGAKKTRQAKKTEGEEGRRRAGGGRPTSQLLSAEEVALRAERAEAQRTRSRPGWLVYDPVFGAVPQEVLDRWQQQQQQQQ